MNDHVLRAHLAPGRVDADTHAPASLLPRYPPPPTVRDSRGPPAQYSPECRAHRSTELVHTACGTQELGTSRLMPEKPVQLSEAVRAHAHHLSPGPGGVQDRRQCPYPSHPLAVTGGAQAE